MNLLKISIILLVVSACYSSDSAEDKLVIPDNNATIITPKSPSEFLKQVESASEAEYTSGDTIKYVSGDLFKTHEKFAIIAYKRKFNGAVYQLYKFDQEKWDLVIDDSANTNEDMYYRIEDFNFDETLDFAFLNDVNMNGNGWYKLYTKKDLSFAINRSFKNIANPIIDRKNQWIKSQYIAGNYDQHSKTIYQYKNDLFQIREMVTIDPVFDKSNEVIGQKVCYYELRNDKLKIVFRKTNLQDISFDLYEKTIPMD